MPKETYVKLGEHFDEFVTNQVRRGRYRSVNEVLQAGLRLLEEREEKMTTLRVLLVEGEQSGISDYQYESLISELDISH